VKAIAIIPARGGSKRITRKNVKDFAGRPIIAYSIDLALNSGLFDEVMVSTDDEEIAEISKRYGAKLPFIRSLENATDFATTADVISEVLVKYQETNRAFDLGCCLYPTAPLLTEQTLRSAYTKIKSQNFDTVFPVVKYSYPIWRSLKMEDGHVHMNWPEHLTSRSQDLPASYHDAGQFYWFKVDRFLKQKSLFTQNSGAVELSEMEVQDIDSLTDWKLAELKYKILNQIE
jgi:pseudaminic acid cytidylyltransferase